MKRSKVIWMIFVCVLFFFGCTREYSCNTPYINAGGRCCLDLDNDKACDASQRVDEAYNAESESYEIIHPPRVLTQADLEDKWVQIEAEDRYDYFVKRAESDRKGLEKKYEKQEENFECDC